MKTITPQLCQQIKLIIASGGVIAYPTEAVYGFGCDPFNRSATLRLKQLKQRDASKGFIVIGSRWSQIQALIGEVPLALMEKVFASWPGPVTWVFPASPAAPEWITDPENRIACRITSHPIAAEICDCLDAPLVSTSANVAGATPFRSAMDVEKHFATQIDLIVAGEVGGLELPTQILDVLTGARLR